MLDVTREQRIHHRIRRTARTAKAIADLARELTRILLWTAAAGLAIATAAGTGGADLLTTALEIVGSIR